LPVIRENFPQYLIDWRLKISAKKVEACVALYALAQVWAKSEVAGITAGTVL
jgi:hypothetical protein